MSWASLVSLIVEVYVYDGSNGCAPACCLVGCLVWRDGDRLRDRRVRQDAVRISVAPLSSRAHFWFSFVTVGFVTENPGRGPGLWGPGLGLGSFCFWEH